MEWNKVLSAMIWKPHCGFQLDPCSILVEKKNLVLTASQKKLVLLSLELLVKQVSIYVDIYVCLCG